MAEKRYYWLKLKEDFFSSKRIKRLRNLAGGDTYTIIYLKMQLKALKDDGKLYFDGIMENFAEELALDIDENPDDVSMVISYLASVGLLETDDDFVYKLTYMDNIIGSETAHTQRQRDYIQRKKEREASLNDAGVTQMLRSGDAEKEIELEREYRDIPPLPPKGDDEFDAFWKAYPKKVGKADAKKKFKTALTKVSLDTMLAALEAQKTWSQWQRDGGQYIPNASTWLNQERWNDEETTPIKGQRSGSPKTFMDMYYETEDDG